VVLAVLAQAHQQVRVKRVVRLLLQAAVDNHVHDLAVLFVPQLELEQLLKRVDIVFAGHQRAKDFLAQVRVHALLGGQVQQLRPARPTALRQPDRPLLLLPPLLLPPPPPTHACEAAASPAASLAGGSGASPGASPAAAAALLPPRPAHAEPTSHHLPRVSLSSRSWVMPWR
jgi:hypothetical protein